MIAQRRLDEIEERLAPFRCPRARRVLRRDDHRAAQSAVRPAHPLAEERQRVRPRLGQESSEEGGGGFAHSPVIVAREPVSHARELARVRARKGRDDQRGELLVHAPRMCHESLCPVEPHPRRQSDAVDDLDRQVVVILSHPAIHTRLAEGVGRAKGVSSLQRTLEPLEPRRGRGDVGRGHARPTKRAMRSHASSIFSRLAA